MAKKTKPRLEKTLVDLNRKRVKLHKSLFTFQKISII